MAGKTAGEVIAAAIENSRSATPIDAAFMIMDALSKGGFTIAIKDWVNRHGEYESWLFNVRDGRCYACAQVPENDCRRYGTACQKRNVARDQMVELCPYNHHLDQKSSSAPNLEVLVSQASGSRPL